MLRETEFDNSARSPGTPLLSFPSKRRSLKLQSLLFSKAKAGKIHSRFPIQMNFARFYNNPLPIWMTVMKMLGLPVHFVKFSIRSKQAPLLALVVAGVITALVWSVNGFARSRSSAHGVNPAKKEQRGCCSDQPATPRRMIGTYYTTEDGFQSTLILNNKGPNQIMVTPILHSQTGQTFTASPVAVGSQSSPEVDLNLLARWPGHSFAPAASNSLTKADCWR